MEEIKSNYLELQDLRQIHVRRVRVMIMIMGLILVVIGFGYGVFFGLRGDFLVALADLSIGCVGAYALWLLRIQKLRIAVWLVNYALLLIFTGMALFLDVPGPAVNRSVHHGFIPLALGSYLMFKGERGWMRHGVSLLSLTAAWIFSSSNFAIETAYAVPDEVRETGVWINNLAAFGALYLLWHVFIGDINRMEAFFQNANNRFVGMVGRMFPRVIAERLLSTGETFAEKHDNCTILFADIVGFTTISETLRPDALVSLLANIFERFDQCVEKYGLTKIKTIGDAYMVAAGVPDPMPDHAHRTLAFAQELLTLIRDIDGINLRIGIASGEVVAGVIGQSRQIFDVWGDVVNTASRMESQGIEGRIQVSQSTHDLTAGGYAFEKRSDIKIKGKHGKHDVFVLISERT